MGRTGRKRANKIIYTIFLDDLICRAEIEMQTRKKYMDTKGGNEGGLERHGRN